MVRSMQRNTTQSILLCTGFQLILELIGRTWKASVHRSCGCAIELSPCFKMRRAGKTGPIALMYIYAYVDFLNTHRFLSYKSFSHASVLACCISQRYVGVLRTIFHFYQRILYASNV